MKPTVLLLVVLLSVFGCMQKPAPVASDTAPATPAEPVAQEVEYVAVPSMQVYASPSETAQVVGKYGFSEAVSVVEKKGDWSRVRTFDGTGWVKSMDMMSPDKAATIDPLVPRFYKPPVEVPYNTRGEITFEARVNTDGDVIDVKLTKNTTGSQALANANGDALKAAKFYPMTDKGMRKTFVYEHKVYY